MHHPSHPAIKTRSRQSDRHPNRAISNEVGYHQAIPGSSPNLAPTRQVSPNVRPSAPNLGSPHPSAPNLGSPRYPAAVPDMAPTLQSAPALRPAPRLPSDPGPPKTMMADAVVVRPSAPDLGAPRASASSPNAQAQSSLQIPISRGARFARIGALLALDAVLIALGIVFLLGYLDARDAAATDVSSAKPGAAPASIEDETGQRRSVESAVSALVDGHRGDIQRCYGAATTGRSDDSPLEGRLDIDLTIDARGAITAAAAKVNDTGSKDLAACVSELFKKWSLPGPPDRAPVHITWPLRFKAPK